MNKKEANIVLLRILEVASGGGDPLALRRAQLLDMRRKVIELCTAEIANRAPDFFPLPIDGDYADAVEFVMGYTGKNEFIKSLRQSLETYGRLTSRQAEAALNTRDREVTK